MPSVGATQSRRTVPQREFTQVSVAIDSFACQGFFAAQKAYVDGIAIGINHRLNKTIHLSILSPFS
jgi:TolB-like protein